MLTMLDGAMALCVDHDLDGALDIVESSITEATSA